MWYAANLLFRSDRNPQSIHEALWEESLRLIAADSEGEAREKARRLGLLERSSYQSNSGETVTWVFDRVERIFAIEAGSLEDGSELFSRFLRTSEVKSLLTPFEDE